MSSYSSNQARARAAFDTLTNPTDRFSIERPTEPSCFRREPQATITKFENLATGEYGETLLFFVEKCLDRATLDVMCLPENVREALGNAALSPEKNYKTDLPEIQMTWATSVPNLMYAEEKAKYDKDMVEMEKAWEAYADRVEVWVAKKNVEHKLTTESKDRIEYERLRAKFEKGT